MGCAFERCTVYFLRDLLGHVRKEQTPMLAALVSRPRGLLVLVVAPQAGDLLTFLVAPHRGSVQ